MERLVRDTLDAVDDDVDFSRYDLAVFFMAVEREAYGMIGMCAYPGMLGWQSTAILTTRRGQRIHGGIALFTYQAHLGTLFHDVAHVLGGVEGGKRRVPCLYDHDLQSRPSGRSAQAIRQTFMEATIHMGFWDPMSCHFYKWQAPPPGISAWTKLRLGWPPQEKLRTVSPGEQIRVTLGPLEDGDAVTLAIKVPLTPTTYYLIENRQPVGFDRNLPGHGILIMRADDAVAECRHGQGPVSLVNADPSVPYLQGAAFDRGKNDTFVDKEHGVRVELVARKGLAYELLVVNAP